tara:strand:+ start:1388 stop:1801 length:414 start_codon:yes stop_codon:yes gene_type:complete
MPVRDKNKNMSIKSTIAAVAASPFLFAGAAFAGPYVNIESNLSYPDGDYTGATTDVHFGYEGAYKEKLGYYIQGGPSINHSEASDTTETELSGKIGGSYALSEDTALYAEVSGQTNEDATGDDVVNWGGKLGVKFLF